MARYFDIERQQSRQTMKPADISLDKLTMEYYTNLVRARRRAVKRDQEKQRSPQAASPSQELAAFTINNKAQAEYY